MLTAGTLAGVGVDSAVSSRTRVQNLVSWKWWRTASRSSGSNSARVRWVHGWTSGVAGIGSPFTSPSPIVPGEVHSTRPAWIACVLCAARGSPVRY
jgi:hypothetical protein